MDFRNSLFIILIFNNQASLKLLWTGLRFTKLDYHTFFLVVFFHCKTANKWFDSRVVALVIPPLKPKVLPEQSLSFSIWIWTFGAATTQAHPFDQVHIGGWSDAWTGNGDVRAGTGSHVTGRRVVPWKRKNKYLVLTFGMFVVYFDQWMCASHAVRWSKLSFRLENKCFHLFPSQTEKR